VLSLALIGVAAFLATLCGGFFALYLSDRLHLILGFSAGAILGVFFFDLLPEALELAGPTHGTATVITAVAIGFAVYLVVDRLVFLHGHSHEHTSHQHLQIGGFGAGTLSLHSFLDGLGIGFAFQVAPAVGIVVAVAVLAHDFSDGVNTVSFIVKHGGSRSTALRWLLVDAIAPLAGVAVTLVVFVSGAQLGLLLALFAGFFLYIGASDLLPESHHAHPKEWTTVSSIAGLAFLYIVIRLAGI
jgi:zinc transporter ZupT